jgi:hypothetical protein
MKGLMASLALLASMGAQSAEVLVALKEGQLEARVVAIEYPATLSKELTSGLTNRLYARVSLLDGPVPTRQRAAEIAIRYDLWDQKFLVVSSMDGIVTESRSLASLEELNALLRALPLPGLFETAGLPGAHEFTVKVEVLLNPIDREKMQKIRKWVARNSAPATVDSGVPMSSALFNRIFEQYADGSNVAAAWRTELSSAAFRIDALKK